jgi:hypothetical protein
MTRQNKSAANEISELANGQEAEAIPSRTAAPNSLVIREPVAKGQKPPSSAANRRWRRKNDITTADGLAREHARLIAAMHCGRVALEDGDILSRTYGRQRDIIATSEIKRSIDNLAQQIADIKNERSVVIEQFPHAGVEN